MKKSTKKLKETKLLRMLKAKRITQRELANRLGMKYTALNYACKYGVKTARVAERYAAQLGCLPNELIDFEESAQ